MESSKQPETGKPAELTARNGSTEKPEALTNIEPSQSDAADPWHLDNPKPLDPATFPHQPRSGGNQLTATIANVRHLLTEYGIRVHYNVIRKKLAISVPGYSGTPDNADNVAISHIVSLASLNGISSGHILSYVATIGDMHRFNPVANWITSVPWDGVDRLQPLYATLTHPDEYPTALKHTLLYRWLISAVAAALKPSGFRSRGVLTLQGPQSIGKTAWINALVPDPILREHTIKLDHHLDASNKDSLLTAISHWIVEIGELDSSFKKDIARLKGFLTSDRDKVRRPYGRTDSEYPRRTVFCATVNDQAFLVDSTGNSRWWTIPVTKIDYTHGIDMQQAFAQIAVDFYKDEPWWLLPAEERELELYNRSHRAISAIHERVLEALDLDRVKEPHLPAMTPTELLRKIGVNNPTNTQSKECAAILRELLGDSKRIKGQNKWRIPLEEDTWSPPSFARKDGKVY